ncbi:peptidyl-prolyl cis-trans isomerase-like 3 isoform X1 [Psammomys obesus]|uniref:peptidyl-prolyl cis-trans isomerase-like 3 isoform X1 n=1 Tax=Psammomys obesus TaxID=48139 RepID=UPI002452E548|nr:peptidyl-prolyl cis-trans isomerase-like 3 isoform X1 [Psammomys obesus]
MKKSKVTKQQTAQERKRPASKRCGQLHTLSLGSADDFQSVTLHTDVGDIKIEVFCERTPKTCENFLALCASNYYNGCVFHRNIKGFMVQTGDPTGTGRGGSSIWGKKFEDEYSEYLKHNVRGVVSMANNGPNTNGSQFFITYGKQPHLDMKYTVFGKQGFSVCSPGCLDSLLDPEFTVPAEVRRGFWVPWNWSCELSCGC